MITVAPDRREATRRAAHAALAICADADRLALIASDAATHDDERLIRLMDQRDELLGDLAEQLAILKYGRPSDDSVLFSQAERRLDELDGLIAEVAEAVKKSEKATRDLFAHLARRSEEIRAELTQVQRTSSASARYGAMAGPQVVDRIF